MPQTERTFPVPRELFESLIVWTIVGSVIVLMFLVLLARLGDKYPQAIEVQYKTGDVIATIWNSHRQFWRKWFMTSQ